MVLTYSYLFVTPGLLLSNNFITEQILAQAKTLSQTFSTMMLLDGFNIDFFMAKTDKNIEQQINQNPELVDIIVCNHVSTIDFLIVMAYLQKFKIGSFNFVLKNEIIYTPGFGLIMFASPDIKLNRNWETDKQTFGKQLDNIKTSSGNKQVILIFPEGTRINNTKLIEAQQYSINNNLPIFSNLLVPKTKGLWFLINHLAQTSKLGKIWDLTLAIPKFLGTSAYLTDIIGKPIGPVYGIFRELELPTDYNDPDQFKHWFLKTWEVKDEFLQNYKKLIYQKITWDEFKIKNMVGITIITLITWLLITNKYSRYYVLVSLLLSYLLIFIKSI
jgi:1-acyl-sn-glycerol-3-phosphate acyltransferase